MASQTIINHGAGADTDSLPSPSQRAASAVQGSTLLSQVEMTAATDTGWIHRKVNEMTPDEIYHCQHKNLRGPYPAMMEDGDWRNVCIDCLKPVSMETCCVCKRTVERGLTVMYLNGAVCDFCLDHNEDRWD